MSRIDLILTDSMTACKRSSRCFRAVCGYCTKIIQIQAQSSWYRKDIERRGEDGENHMAVEGRRGGCKVTGTFLLEAFKSGTIPFRRSSNIVSRVKAG